MIGLSISRVKRLQIASALILAVGAMASSFGIGVVIPVKLELMQSESYYALNTTLSTMGMMLILPMIGTLSEKLGMKNIAAIGVLLQLLARIGSIPVQTPMIFIFLQFIGNVGCGMYMTLPYSLISSLVQEKERTKYFGLIAAGNAAGALIGPTLAGYLVGSGHMGPAFLVYAPLSLLAVVGLFLFYPGTQMNTEKREKFDFTGLALLFISIGSLVLLLNMAGKQFAWISLESALLLACFCITFVLLIRLELRHPNPSVPIGMFRKSRFRTSFVCITLISAYNVCIAGFAIIFVQQVMGLSAQTSSTVTIPQTMTQAVVGVAAGRIIGGHFIKRLRPAALLTLVLPVAAALLLFSMGQHSSMLILYTASALGGISLATAQCAFIPFFQSQLSGEEYTAAQGMYTFGGVGGSCIFSAIAGSMLNAGLTYNHIFLLAAALCFAAFAYGYFGFRISGEENNMLLAESSGRKDN